MQQMAVISKYFTTHKRGDTDEDIQDSVCVNEENGRYALSDGVSKSFLPRLLADILTETYVASSDEDAFPPTDLPDLFVQRKEAYIAALDEFGATMQEIAEETLVMSAATFVGLTIHDQYVSWRVIGDSCLFIIPDTGDIHCICSEKINISPDRSIHIAFGNHPAQIRSDGVVCGNIIEGRAPKETGWYILMSDKISDWFIGRHNCGDNVIQRLFSLNNNAEFEAMIEEEFQAKNIENDDCSVVLIRVCDGEAINSHLIKDEPDSSYFDYAEAEGKFVMECSENGPHEYFEKMDSDTLGSGKPDSLLSKISNLLSKIFNLQFKHSKKTNGNKELH